MMDIGMQGLLEFSSARENAVFCAALGLQFVELNMNLPAYQVEQLDGVELRALREELGVYFTLHLDENLNPCDFNERVAEAYTQTVLNTIALAAKADIPILNMHLSDGVYFTLPERKVYLYDEYAEVYRQRLAVFRDACTAAVGDSDVYICVENAGRFSGDALDILLESRAFGLTFDIGHAAKSSTHEAVILQREERLRHMHLHDAVERRDHLPLGSGELNVLYYLQLAQKRKCRAVLEVKTAAGLRESVGYLRELEGCWVC